MGLQAQITDRVAILYAGCIVEMAPTKDIFKSPLHPYTRFLISSLPVIGRKAEKRSISGYAPSLLNPPSGCRFHPRCPIKKEICEKIKPSLVEVQKGHQVSCHVVAGG